MTSTQRRVVWALLVLGVLGFALLALLYSREPLSLLDTHIYRWIEENIEGRRVESLARPFFLFPVLIVALGFVAAGVLVRERNWLDLGFLFVAIVGSELVVVLLKDWIDRPYVYIGPGLPGAYPALPSGHATDAVTSLGAFAVLLAERIPSPRVRKWMWAGVAVLAIGVGVSQVVLNQHLVTDVLAGWCLGVAWLAGCLLVRDRLRRPLHAGGALEPETPG